MRTLLPEAGSRRLGILVGDWVENLRIPDLAEVGTLGCEQDLPVGARTPGNCIPDIVLAKTGMSNTASVNCKSSPFAWTQMRVQSPITPSNGRLLLLLSSNCFESDDAGLAQSGNITLTRL
jgi:hypothetical protein